MCQVPKIVAVADKKASRLLVAREWRLKRIIVYQLTAWDMDVTS
jgi:hypothetical protein